MNTQRKKLAWFLMVLLAMSSLWPCLAVAQEEPAEVEEAEVTEVTEVTEGDPEAKAKPDKPSDEMVKLFNTASKSVGLVAIRDQDYRAMGLGSGFFVSADGKFITNYHVIKGATYVRVRMSDEDETEYTCKALAVDPDNDLALLKLDVGDKKVAYLPLASDKFPDVATVVCAIGNPAGLTNTFSEGRISGIRENGKRKDLQVTAPIAPGSSGGPLLDMSGEVVGVTTWVRGTELGFVGNLNFAVPVKHVRALIKSPGKMRELQEGEMGNWFGEGMMSDMDKAREALANRDLAEAYSLLSKLLEEEKDNAFVYDAMGDFYFTMRRFKKAISYYEKALKINPKIVNSNFYIADAYANLKMFPKALVFFKKTLELKPYETKTVDRMVETYKEMGQSSMAMKEYKKAIEAFDEALALKADDFDMYYYKGEAYAAWKKYQEAIKAYQKFLAYKAVKYKQFGPDYSRGWVKHYSDKALRAQRRIGEMHLRIRLAKTQ